MRGCATVATARRFRPRPSIDALVKAQFLLALVVPVAVVVSFVYGYKTWHGEDVHVPIIGDFIDNRVTSL